MHIKLVKEYSVSYCELVVTDNLKNVTCICDSVPLNNGMIPTKGMKINMLNAFFCNEIPKIKCVSDIKKQNNKLSRVGLFGMAYYLRGKVFDEKKYIIKVHDFYISLEYLFSSDYDSPHKFPFKEGEWIEFIADRLDAVI